MAFNVYEAFREYVKEHILEYLPPEYEKAVVTIVNAEKNNGTNLFGLRILKPNEKVCPNIYMENYFNLWAGNLKSMEDTLKDMANFRLVHDKSVSFDESKVLDFEKAKDNIIFRVVNQEGNEDILKKIPFTAIEDLALTYHVVVKLDEEISGTIQVNNEIFHGYGVSLETLYEIAANNMSEQMHYTFTSMKDMMRNAVLRNIIEESGVDKDTAEMIVNDVINNMEEDTEMYVVSTEEVSYGATAFFCPGVQEAIAQRLGGDYYMLPSSLHELMIMRADCGMTVEELKAIVQEVNETQVAHEDKLSDHVYAYDAKEKKLYRADKTPEREEKKEKGFRERLKEKQAESKALSKDMAKPEKKKREECL